MADYARRGDQSRDSRRNAESVRRLRTRRPLRGHVPSPTWVVSGTITTDIYLPPALVAIDPHSGGDYPEHKQIIAFDAFLQSGLVTLNWKSNDGYIYTGHNVESGTNRLVLDEPFLIENGAFGGEWIQPEIDDATGAANLSCVFIVETVPT